MLVLFGMNNNTLSQGVFKYYISMSQQSLVHIVFIVWVSLVGCSEILAMIIMFEQAGAELCQAQPVSASHELVSNLKTK